MEPRNYYRDHAFWFGVWTIALPCFGHFISNESPIFGAIFFVLGFANAAGFGSAYTIWLLWPALMERT